MGTTHRQRIELPDGTSYDGGLDADGNFDGEGTLRMKDGGTYAGEWRNGKHHGKGKLKLASGYEYDGEWVDGRRNGFGYMNDDEGRSYSGEWTDGRQSGTGSMVYKGGATFSGSWSGGVPHGQGVFTNRDASIVLRGTWVNGRRQERLGVRAGRAMIGAARRAWRRRGVRVATCMVLGWTVVNGVKRLTSALFGDDVHAAEPGMGMAAAQPHVSVEQPL